MKCTEKLSIDKRKKEFEKSWSSYEARFAILQGSVIKANKRSYFINSIRVFSRNGKLCNLPVCKKAFLNTLGISQSRIDVAFSKFRKQSSISDKRGVDSGGKNAINSQPLLQIKQFIESLPKYCSHYCRNTTSAIFFAPNLNLIIIYNLYKEKYKNYVSFSRLKNHTKIRLSCDLYKDNKIVVTGEQLVSVEKEHKNSFRSCLHIEGSNEKRLGGC